MLKRAFDIVVSFLGLVLLSPLLLFIAILVIVDSKGGIFFIQQRVGMNGDLFNLIKFRTMAINSEKGSSLTIGGKDSRITRVGYYLRKFKIDELPQLFNVLKGDMSIVGPRPELQKYVNMYNESQMEVLKIRPGITDLASIKYRNESELLFTSSNPEEFYVSKLMPEKLKLNKEYMANSSFLGDMRIIFKTFIAIFK